MIDKGADVLYAERFGVSDAAKERGKLGQPRVDGARRQAGEQSSIHRRQWRRHQSSIGVSSIGAPTVAGSGMRPATRSGIWSRLVMRAPSQSRSAWNVRWPPRSGASELHGGQAEAAGAGQFVAAAVTDVQAGLRVDAEPFAGGAVHRGVWFGLPDLARSRRPRRTGGRSACPAAPTAVRTSSR